MVLYWAYMGRILGDHRMYSRIRILHSGSKPQDKGGFQKPWFV